MQSKSHIHVMTHPEPCGRVSAEFPNLSQVPTNTPPTNSSDARRRCALLVEDDPVFQDALSQAFIGLGGDWEIVRLAAVTEAIAWLDRAQDAPNVLLVDIGLPDGSGIDVIREARKKFSELPALVVSVVASESALLEAMRAGACGYLLKGEPTISLKHSIEGVLAGNYPISPSLARYLVRLVAPHRSSPEETGERPLSSRELQVLQRLAEGLSYGECADALGVTLSTVQSHVRNIYRKLEVNSQIQAVVKARRFGVI